MVVPSTKQITFIINKVGRSDISRTPITRTLSNSTGRETLTKGTPATMAKSVAMNVDISWKQEEIAKLEGADGYILTLPTTTLNEYDYVTFDSKTYEVTKLTTIKYGATSLHKYGLLTLKE